MDAREVEILRERYMRLINTKDEADLTEANTRAKIVAYFLQSSGYKEDWQSFEYPLRKGKHFTDITIKKNDKIIMIVEVKKAGKTLTDSDVSQLCDYLNNQKTEWGILTNGRDYWLVNNDIDSSAEQRFLFKYNLLDIIDTKYDLLSYKSLFEEKTTLYKKYIRQYELYKLRENENLNTLSTYLDTISDFFDYLTDKYSFRELKHISSSDFKQFLKSYISSTKQSKSEKTISSPRTIINKYRHISNFYSVMNKYTEKDLINPFAYMNPEDMLNGVIDKQDEDAYFLNMTPEIINCIKNDYHGSKTRERQRLIFLLSLYLGLRREDLRLLKTEDISYEKNQITVKGFILKIPEYLTIEIKRYITEHRGINPKVDYIFDSNYGDWAGGPLSIGSINRDIKKCSQFIKSCFPEIKIKLTFENIRIMLVREMFKCNFTLEEIATITNMSLNSISKYISNEDIHEKTEIISLPSKHPFYEFFS